jgi:hypothetical protein
LVIFLFMYKWDVGSFIKSNKKQNGVQLAGWYLCSLLCLGWFICWTAELLLNGHIIQDRPSSWGNYRLLGHNQLLPSTISMSLIYLRGSSSESCNSFFSMLWCFPPSFFLPKSS